MSLVFLNILPNACDPFDHRQESEAAEGGGRNRGIISELVHWVLYTLLIIRGAILNNFIMTSNAERSISNEVNKGRHFEINGRRRSKKRYVEAGGSPESS